MKALIYKEFKLAMHPICYIFILAFPFMVLIPNYPTCIGFIYILTSYPILFLGANKGQQSNDLLFSTLMPVRKKDIVLARIITVAIMQFTFILVSACLVPFAIKANANLNAQVIAEGGEPVEIPGLSLDGYLSSCGIALIGLSFADLIYFSIYYKNGKSIVLSTLLSLFGFIIYITIFTIVIPYIPGLEGYKTFLCDSGIGVQILVFGISLLIYLLLHFVTFKVSSKNLEKVDF